MLRSRTYKKINQCDKGTYILLIYIGNKRSIAVNVYEKI